MTRPAYTTRPVTLHNAHGATRRIPAGALVYARPRRQNPGWFISQPCTGFTQYVDAATVRAA